MILLLMNVKVVIRVRGTFNKRLILLIIYLFQVSEILNNKFAAEERWYMWRMNKCGVVCGVLDLIDFDLIILLIE